MKGQSGIGEAPARSGYCSIGCCVMAGLCAACLLLAGAVSRAAEIVIDPRFEPLIISQPGTTNNLASHSLVFEDSSHELAIGDIVTPERQLQFEPHPGGLEFGYTSSAMWIALVLDNRQQEEDEFLLEVAYPLIDSIILYEPQYDADGQNLQWVSHVLGDTLPFDQRRFKLRTFVFKIRLEPGQVKPFFLRVASTSSLSVPLTLYSENAYYEYLHDHQTYMGIFYGICFGLLAYNLFLYLTLREKSYLLYLGVVLSNVYAAACFDGFNYSVVPWFPYWQSVAIYASICMTIWFSNQFARVYLHSRSVLPRSDRMLRWIAYLSMTQLVLLLLFPGKLMSVFILVTVAVSVVVILSSATLSARSGYKPAKLFLLAWIVMLTPIFVGVLNALNILAFHEITPYIHKIGVAGEMIILSLALGSRINMLKQAEQDALQLANKAEAEGKAKNEFLAKMSHEIRTPMNGVLGMAELLKETPLKSNQMHYVRTIYNSGQALLGIINDILDYSKIEAGKLDIDSVEFNLEDLLDECVSVFALRSSDQKVPLISLLDPAVPKMIKGDPARMRQIIINLLSNAFKFTEQGEVRLNVTLDEKDEPWLRLKFSITDSGIGISEQQQERLFKSFSQADASTTRKYGGTGLGLAICKELAELMGGEIGVDSRPGTGSTFWFTVVLEASADQRNSRMDKVLQELSGHTLLVVDDNVHIRTVIKTLAESWGMKVMTAHTGLAAVEMVASAHRANHNIDVALLDLELPDINGIEVSRRILRLPVTKFPHLLITAARQLPRKEDLENSGITVSIEKPIPASHLRKSLARAMTGVKADSDDWFEQDLLNVDFSDLRILVAEDNNVNQLVVAGMLKRLGISPDMVSNGLEAVERVKSASAPYDAILMDCEMPLLDGYDATRQIRAYEQIRKYHTLIFALTAHAMQEHLQKSRSAGMDDHIAKPVSIAELKEAMGRVRMARQSGSDQRAE